MNRIYLNADGETHDIVEGPFDTTQHQTPPYKYLNTIVGRYVNRIPTKENGHLIEKDGISATIKPIYNGACLNYRKYPNLHPFPFIPP